MFKVKIYTKLYVFGVKRLFGFLFFSSSSSPQGMVPGPSAGVCLCASTRLSVCVYACVCAHLAMKLSHRYMCILALRCQYLLFSPLFKWRHCSALEVSHSEVGRA